MTTINILSIQKIPYTKKLESVFVRFIILFFKHIFILFGLKLSFYLNNFSDNKILILLKE